MSVMLECQAVKVTNSEPGLGDITTAGQARVGAFLISNISFHFISIKDEELQ